VLKDSSFSMVRVRKEILIKLGHLVFCLEKEKPMCYLVRVPELNTLNVVTKGEREWFFFVR